MWKQDFLDGNLQVSGMVPFLVGFVLVIVALSFLRRRSDRKLPPGPRGLPIFGYSLFLLNNHEEKFKELVKKYGKVFSLYLGPKYIVILNSWEAMTEALSQDCVLNRPEEIFAEVPYNFGVVGANGQEWIHTRRVTSRAIKDIGLNRIGWEEHLQAEALDLVNRIIDEGEKPIAVRTFFAESFVNNVVTLILGERLYVGHPITRIIAHSVEAIIEYTPTLGMANYSSTLSKLLQILGLEKENLLTEKVDEFGKFVSKTVDEKLEKNISSVEDSFIGRFDAEIQNSKKNKGSTHITEDTLKGNVTALLTGGGETTRTTVIWALMAMADNPDIQRKVHEELDSVIGKDGFVKWMHRSKVPYTYATLMESMRYRTVVPFGTLRIVTRDMEIQGYHIPKGSYMTFNNWAIHSDPRYWPDPEKFCPERFLRDGGKKVITSLPSFNAFSYGKRNCPGKMLAEVVGFLYFVTLMQKFEVRPKDDKKVQNDTLLGLTYQATNVELRFIPR